MIERISAAAAGIGLGFVIVGYGVQANPQEHALDANLYMQTSAEYRATCIQAYNWAGERLISKLSTLPSESKPPAVILDLDETVIDNAAFQSFLDREKLNYSEEAWATWENKYSQEVRMIPGAAGFIKEAERRGVRVVYLSNRAEKSRASTTEALKLNGLSLDGIDGRLLLKTDSSDKTPRRQTVEDKYAVLMYIGDNLRDFSEQFVTPKLDFGTADGRSKAIQQRGDEVDKTAYRFGSDWIVLPNPVYGEWQKPLGKDARLNLRPTKMSLDR